MSIYIKADGLSLSVPMYVQNERAISNWRTLLFSALFDPPRRQFRTLLESVSFEINEGDRVAVLGRNGAGKSTLLRSMNGVYQPTKGRVEISGTCQALLNNSLGFNGDATVKENIFLRANAMRLDNVPIGERINPILEFSGLEGKANHRLKTLSAGQKMRLGFAISTEVQHDIMILDEWVGTGDAEFIKRAKQRMAERLGGSKIVVLASHNFSMLKDVCEKGMVLERGRVVYFGPLVDAFKAYNVITAMPALGDAPAGQVQIPTVGCVDEVSVVDGKLRVRGWAVYGSEGLPKVLSIVSAAGSWLVNAPDAHSRPDVASAMALDTDRCGYLLEIDVMEISGISGLGGVLQVFGGSSAEDVSGPFRMGNDVLKVLTS